MAKKRRMPPFECEIERLGPRGVGEGHAPDGSAIKVRGAPPGSRVHVVPAGKRKGMWTGRRTVMVRPPVGYSTPRCAVFGLCGGCVLQELDLDAQRASKHELATRQVADGLQLGSVQVHPVRGAPEAYGYRNKVELSFGPKRYLSQADQDAGLPHGGRFLGMHAPGRFDRIVDAQRCELVSDALNGVLTQVRSVALQADAPDPYDPHTHLGFWRHALLREGSGTGERLLGLYTAAPSDGDADWVERVVDAVGDRCVGVVWFVNEGVADVARGEVMRTWGRDHLHEKLGPLTVRLSPSAFFQTSTGGAQVLYDTIGEALGRGGTLLDLYCGIGSIGLYLADRVDAVVGIEEVEAAVADARANAAASGLQATYRVDKVENALDAVQGGDDVRIVVDPPRAGLHPRVAQQLASTEAAVLVYVACNPASLGRDAAILTTGGWYATDLWTVDLFPQTGHVESVARFERRVS